MLKYDLNFPLKDLDGKEIQGQNIATYIANLLLSETKGNAIKLYDMAINIHKEKHLVCDDADKKMLCEIINNKENLTVLAKAQLLKVLENGVKND